MILRRVTEHVKAQNWFAVGIDFVIVVVGVFIGIQVADWNGNRLDRIEAGKVLDRLEQEFRMHLERTDLSLARHQASLEATARVIHGIRNARFEQDTLADDLDLLAGFATPPGPSTTFQELVSSGRVRLLAGAPLRSALLGYNDYVSLVRSSYEVFIRPLSDARAALLRARTLRVTGKPSGTIIDTWSTESVDQDILLADRDLMVRLQVAYGTQDNIYAVLRANRTRIVEILGLIAAEREQAR